MKCVPSAWEMQQLFQTWKDGEKKAKRVENLSLIWNWARTKDLGVKQENDFEGSFISFNTFEVPDIHTLTTTAPQMISKDNFSYKLNNDLAIIDSN